MKTNDPMWTNRSLICAAIAVASGMAVSQIVHASDTATTAATREEVGRTAILLLRDGDIELALKALAAVSDGVTPNTLSGEDGHSSVGAGLHRAIAQLSSEAQFELLSKWSMPAESPAKIRVLSVLVPTLAPPAEFARALGERPRGTSFPVSSIGEVRGLFSTAWSLVVAARETGRLKRLVTDAGQLADKKVPNAELLLALAQIADRRGDVSRVTEAISKRVTELKGAAPANGAGPVTIDPADVVIACAAVQHPTLRPLGEEMLAVLLDSTHGRPASRVRPFLRQSHATAMLTSHEDSDALDGKSKLDPRLKYWVPVSSTRSVVMRGDWPKVRPPVTGQELAGKTTEWADADLPRLKSVFTHSFEKEGLPEKYFELPAPNRLLVQTAGIRAMQNSEKDPITWEITPRFALSGWKNRGGLEERHPASGADDLVSCSIPAERAATISFSPDSQQVIAAIDNRDGNGNRLHSINIRQPGQPRLLEAIPASEQVDGVAWSRDGKSIAISVRDIAQPTEWVAGMKTD